MCRKSALFFTFFVCLLASTNIFGQSTSDVEGAITVCQNSYTQDTVASGIGNVDDLQDGDCSVCIDNGENNSTWYIFTVQNGGVLTFDIIPLGAVDYDFTLFDITNFSLLDVINCTGQALEVRCNYAVTLPGFSNITGLRPGYPDTISHVAGDQFLAPLTVQANQTFLLLVDNFQNSSTGYTINFTGTAEIVDVTPPEVELVGSGYTANGASGTGTPPPFDCTPSNTIIIEISEYIDCGSLNTSISNMTITGPGNVNITSIVGLDCDSIDQTKWVQVFFDAPITSGGAYTLTVPVNTFADFCGNPNALDTYIFDVPQVVDADFTYTINASCLADTFYFENTSFGNNFSQTIWDFGDGSSGSNQANPAHVFPGQTTYNVKLTVIGAAPDFCTDSITIPVTVGSSFSASFTYSPTTVCPGDQVDFTNTSNGVGNLFWTFGNGDVSTLQNPNTTYNTAGVYTVTIEVSDPLDPNCFDSASAIVSVKPVVDIKLEIDPDPVCEGQPVNFISETIEGSPRSWLIAISTGDTIYNDTATITFDTTGLFDVDLYVVDSFCGTDSDQLSINVIERPYFNLGNDTSVCKGDSVSLELPNADAYAWSSGETTQEILVLDIPTETAGIIDVFGCLFSDTILIFEQTENCYQIIIPTGFSPNGDGINDYVKIFTKKIESGTIKIFNRWGQSIYEGNIMDTRGWDGTYNKVNQEMGTYTYVIEAKPLAEKPIFYQSGIVTLVR